MRRKKSLPATIFSAVILLHLLMSPIGNAQQTYQVFNAGSSTRDIRATTPGQEARSNDHGAFRISCQYSHTNKDDFILFPNQPGRAHHHLYLGNTQANASMTTYESQRTRGNSTCMGGIVNRSAYWTPTLFDRSSVPIVAYQNLIYYKSFAKDLSKVVTPPDGLRIIAGNANATSPQSLNVVEYICLNPNEQLLAKSSTIPTCAQGNDILRIISFPQCWNGANLDSPDHKSHMAYSVNNTCSPSHPKEIPHITFFNRYRVTASSGTNGWYLSSDRREDGSSVPPGTSTHGDWAEGWEPAIKARWVNNCIRGSLDCGVGKLGDGQELYLK